ncbi:hypothetical protein [Primorskyibacter sp. S187A]|uniref:hypothetical protein n=1 Tax=Primorskyibacter sp. S187A TaxID=3415130 RepID=UPI003C7D8182
MITRLTYPLALLGAASAAQAIAVPECTRVTHISHAGEEDHVDLGEGRVMWTRWWSQEGSASDIFVVDCADGAGLRFRVAEANMSARLPFDRRTAAMHIVDIVHSGDRVFATMDRLARDVSEVAKDVTHLRMDHEPCACAAHYPDLRGDKTGFEFERLPEGFARN